eukprot:COSAG02_NODE_7851_length_2818_cov_1.966900_2_plen_316_part_00
MDSLFADTDDLEAMRAVVVGMDDEVTEALTAGVVFVICGEVADTNDNYANLATLLKPKAQQVIRADELGAPVDEEQATQVLNDISDFLYVRRLSEQHVDKVGLLRDAIDDKDTIKGVLSDRNAQQAATHTASLVKIVTAQVQQSFSFLSFPWDWPAVLVELKTKLGAWVLIDIPTVMGTGCLLGGGNDAVVLPGLSGSLLLVGILCCCCGKSALNRYRWTHHGNEEAAARAGHAANFGWALYTLATPAIMVNLLKMAADPFVGGGAPLAFCLSVPIWLFVPIFASNRLRHGAEAGILHSRAFEARYGWLCSRYAG